MIDTSYNYTIVEQIKNTGIFLGGLCLIANASVNMGFLLIRREGIQTAINVCCIQNLQNPTACVIALERLIGPGLNVSTFADLCGSGLRLFSEANGSSLVPYYFIMVSVATIPLGFAVKKVYDYCTSIRKVDDNFEAIPKGNSDL